MAIVLLPLDSSKHSEKCLDYYLRSVHREGNKVHCVYVADYFGDVGVMDGPTPGRIQELEEKDRAKSAQIEKAVLEVFKAQKIDGCYERVTAKEVWHAVIDQANKINATMIVMGSRGMGKIRRTILGSVSESVLHHSPIPVLIVKHD